MGNRGAMASAARSDSRQAALAYEGLCARDRRLHFAVAEALLTMRAQVVISTDAGSVACRRFFKAYKKRSETAKAVVVSSLRLDFGFLGKSPHALIGAVGLAAMAMSTGARAAVQRLDLDGCFGNCDPSQEHKLTATQEGSDLKITLSLCGGDSNDSDHHALVFDLNSAPAILVGPARWPFESGVMQMSGVQRFATPYGDFTYVADLPRQGDAPSGITGSSFLTHTRALTLSEMISGLNAFFASPQIRRP